MKETRKQLENQNERLRKALAEVEHIYQSRTDYMSQVTRNIRIPMNTVTGLIAIARMNIDDKGKILECLDKMEQSGQQVTSLINKISDITELNDRIMVLEETPFNLRESVWQTAAMFAGQIRDKNLTLRMVVKEVIHENLIGDVGRIRQILSNLLSNAVKYTLPGGMITITASQIHTFQNNYSLFRFEVEDNGIGISPEFMQKMYQPFERAEDPLIKGEQGAGLGLAISMRIVRMMSGDMTAISEPGKGSKFTVTLHLKRGVEKNKSDRYQATPILIVGEEKATAKDMVQTLRKEKITADQAATAAECLIRLQDAAAARTPYRVVLINWQLGEPGAMALAGIIDERMGGEAPGILFVSNEWKDVFMKGRMPDFADFITRPITLPKLFTVLDRIFPKATAKESKCGKNVSLAGKRMLIAEDNELNAEIIKELLYQNGVVVDVAENGSVAVDMLNTKEADYYDCVLMDIRMPVLNGYAAAQKIRKSKRDDLKRIPIIAMTADTFSVDIRKAKEAGMDAHVAKPYDIGELMEVFAQFIT